LYYLGKTNVVANALSRKYMGSFTHLVEIKRIIIKGLQKLVKKGDSILA
jgi:hypothetical protein